MLPTRPLLAVVSMLALAGAAPLPADEVPPEVSLPCFPGAIYRKAVSSVDQWTGIEATVTLPTLTTDPERVDAKNGKPLDNASCYVGGRAGETEIDAGVSWEVIREADGSVSKERKAFRPFSRNKKWATAPADPKLYFYPGDTIRMSCATDAADKLRFRVELVSRAPGENRPDGGTYEVTFDAPGFGPGRPQQFKRVTAIDQVHNEGKPYAPTHASVAGAVWRSVGLLRGGGDRRPMTPARFTDLRCPDRELVTVADVKEDETAERVDLTGTPAASTRPGKAR